MTTKLGGISPNDFITTLADFIAARTKEESAAGTRRGLMARFEKLGVHKPGLQLFLKLRNMEDADAELTLVSALRYCRWAQLKVGDQPNLFASDDLGKPSGKAADGLSEALAYEEGFAAGKAGRDASDSRFPPGTPIYAKFYDGWTDGQATLAQQLGEDRPADGSTLRKKSKKGVESRGAKPRGGRRGGRRRAAAEDRAGA